MKPIVEVHHLYKKYRIIEKQPYYALRDNIMRFFNSPFYKKTGNDRDEFWALRDISFSVNPGEVVGIIGRNGAGKSTLLKILSRITAPTKGRAVLRGRVSSLLEVGTGFNPELTGRENIYLNGSILGMKRWEIRKNFDDIVAFAEVEKFLDTPVKHYSSGMYMRLAFAVAAHLESEILLIDEILAVGDFEFQKKCIDKMIEVAKDGRTIFLVSHNMLTIKELCKTSVLLSKGRIQMIGKTSKVINTYLQDRQKTSYISLKNRKDRQGEGHIKFIDTWIENKYGRKVDIVQAGSLIKIVATYEIEDDANVEYVTAGIAFSSIENMVISACTSEVSGDTFPLPISKKGRIECLIPKLPLNTGGYTYNLIIRNNMVIEDWIINAGAFDVEGGYFFASGKLPPKEQGNILIEYKWKMNSFR